METVKQPQNNRKIGVVHEIRLLRENALVRDSHALSLYLTDSDAFVTGILERLGGIDRSGWRPFSLTDREEWQDEPPAAPAVLQRTLAFYLRFDPPRYPQQPSLPSAAAHEKEKANLSVPGHPPLLPPPKTDRASTPEPRQPYHTELPSIHRLTPLDLQTPAYWAGVYMGLSGHVPPQIAHVQPDPQERILSRMQTISLMRTAFHPQADSRFLAVSDPVVSDWVAAFAQTPKSERLPMPRAVRRKLEDWMHSLQTQQFVADSPPFTTFPISKQAKVNTAWETRGLTRKLLGYLTPEDVTKTTSLKGRSHAFSPADILRNVGDYFPGTHGTNRIAESVVRQLFSTWRQPAQTISKFSTAQSPQFSPTEGGFTPHATQSQRVTERFVPWTAQPQQRISIPVGAARLMWEITPWADGSLQYILPEQPEQNGWQNFAEGISHSLSAPERAPHILRGREKTFSALHAADRLTQSIIRAFYVVQRQSMQPWRMTKQTVPHMKQTEPMAKRFAPRSQYITQTARDADWFASHPGLPAQLTARLWKRDRMVLPSAASYPLERVPENMRESLRYLASEEPADRTSLQSAPRLLMPTQITKNRESALPTARMADRLIETVARRLFPMRQQARGFPRNAAQPTQFTGQFPQVGTQPTQFTGQFPRVGAQPTQFMGQFPQGGAQPTQFTGQFPQVGTQLTQFTGQFPRVGAQPTQFTGQFPQVGAQPTQFMGQFPQGGTQPTQFAGQFPRVGTQPTQFMGQFPQGGAQPTQFTGQSPQGGAQPTQFTRGFSRDGAQFPRIARAFIQGGEHPRWGVQQFPLPLWEHAREPLRYLSQEMETLEDVPNSTRLPVPKRKKDAYSALQAADRLMETISQSLLSMGRQGSRSLQMERQSVPYESYPAQTIGGHVPYESRPTKNPMWRTGESLKPTREALQYLAQGELQGMSSPGEISYDVSALAETAGKASAQMLLQGINPLAVILTKTAAKRITNVIRRNLDFPAVQTKAVGREQISSPHTDRAWMPLRMRSMGTLSNGDGTTSSPADGIGSKSHSGETAIHTRSGSFSGIPFTAETLTYLPDAFAIPFMNDPPDGFLGGSAKPDKGSVPDSFAERSTSGIADAFSSGVYKSPLGRAQRFKQNQNQMARRRALRVAQNAMAVTRTRVVPGYTSEPAELTLASGDLVMGGSVREMGQRARKPMTAAEQEAREFFEARAAITRNVSAYGGSGIQSGRPMELAYQQKSPVAREQATAPVQTLPERRVVRGNTRQNDAEINRLVERIYDKLERKLKTESRRFGF